MSLKLVKLAESAFPWDRDVLTVNFDGLGLSLEHLEQAGCDTLEKQKAFYKAALAVRSGEITTLESLEDALGARV